MADKLEERLKAVVVELLGVRPEQVNRETSFADDLGAEALDMIDLTLALEEILGRGIPEEDALKLTTFGKALDYLREERK